MNKRSESLFQKRNFSLPGSDKFLNFFSTAPKTFQLSLGVAGKENTDFVSFVTILPIFAAKRPDYAACWTEPTMFRPGWNKNGISVNSNKFHLGLKILDSVQHLDRMTSDRSEQFSSRSHINIFYKNHYNRNEIALQWFRSGLL